MMADNIYSVWIGHSWICNSVGQVMTFGPTAEAAAQAVNYGGGTPQAIGPDGLPLVIQYSGKSYDRLMYCSDWRVHEKHTPKTYRQRPGPETYHIGIGASPERSKEIVDSIRCAFYDPERPRHPYGWTRWGDGFVIIESFQGAEQITAVLVTPFLKGDEVGYVLDMHDGLNHCFARASE